jgi:fructose/tagatose bisphosphate aldolase
MKQYQTSPEIRDAVSGIIEIFPDNSVKILKPNLIRDALIDNLIYSYVFTDNIQMKKRSSWLIRAIAKSSGIITASIHPIYQRWAQGDYPHITVPAINIRTMTYDVARSVFRSALKHKLGLFIFEIARSEMRYTQQEPEEYALCILAAAIKENYQGQVFIQGDHFQVSSKKYRSDPDEEINELKNLIKKAIDAGFYNIDIDASTLVDLSQATIEKQQRDNACITALLTEFIRSIEPGTISVGGEIGEVGKQNSTPEELRAFMKQYHSYLRQDIKGLSKISVQTGTKHGGVVLSDGTIADAAVDFETLRTLSEIARQEFGMAGAVQHGASTLPDKAFDRFPQAGTAEIHLATDIQNIIYEHPSFPKDLLKKIKEYLMKNHSDERKAKDTDEQFLYKTRKKAFGPFKKQLWDIPPENTKNIMKTLENRFGYIFTKLKAANPK